MSDARLMPLFPDEIGPYRLIRQIGSGGFSDVFLALDGAGARVALKLFRNELVDTVDRERYRREVETLHIDHPNLVRYIDSGEIQLGGDARQWLATEYLEGDTLKKVLKDAGGKLPPARASEIGRQVAFGLVALHENGSVHRDLKPGNIHVGADGIVRLLDFGIVSLLDTTTITLVPPGTLAYAAPEQLRGEKCISIDIWALGVVIFEMLAGQRPFRGDHARIYGAILEDDPEPVRAFNPLASPELEALVARLLEKEPIKRPASARDVAAMLRPQIGLVEPVPAKRYDRSSEPRVYARIGLRDAGALTQACLRGGEPSGIVAGVTEPFAVGEARRATAHTNIDFLVDPLIPRMGSLSFMRTKSLRDAPYAPSGLEPFTPADFKSRAKTKEWVRSVLSFQDDLGATRLFAPGFPMRSPDDRMIATNAKLIDFAAAESGVYGKKKVVAQVPLSLDAIATDEARKDVVNRLRRADPDEWWLMLNPLQPSSDLGQLATGLRFALLLQESGGCCIVTRAGVLRHLLLAFGVGGVEVGLGRLNGYRFSDYESKGGPGYTPPLFEFPSLLAALPQDQARAVLAAGILPEGDCECRSCREAATVEARTAPAASAEHNAYVLHEQRIELAGVIPALRVQRLRERIDGARAWEKRLRSEKLIKGDYLKHLPVWVQLIEDFGDELLEDDQTRRRRAS